MASKSLCVNWSESDLSPLCVFELCIEFASMYNKKRHLFLPRAPPSPSELTTLTTPEIVTSSPGMHLSTRSSVSSHSMVRGMRPSSRLSSVTISCSLTFCQSVVTAAERSGSSDLPLHWAVRIVSQFQAGGKLYLDGRVESNSKQTPASSTRALQTCPRSCVEAFRSHTWRIKTSSRSARV